MRTLIIVGIILGIIFWIMIVHSELKERNRLEWDKMRETYKKRQERGAEKYKSFGETPLKIMEGLIISYLSLLSDIKEIAVISEKLENLKKDIDKPLTVIIMGDFKTGKSTFINTLLNRDCLSVGITPETATVTMISYGKKESLIVHYKDMKSKEYPFHMLGDLSSEGNKEFEQVRAKIYYIEITLPEQILKLITIVDTPGLNSNISAHTETTKYFLSRAEMILWVFSCSKAGAKNELSELQSISENLKPIGVINRIDEIDEEEEDIEEVLKNIKQRVGKYLSSLVGVSAKVAREAIGSNDAVLLEKSRWKEFIKVLDSKLLKETNEKKLTSIAWKLSCILKEWNEMFNKCKLSYKEAYNSVHHSEKMILDLKVKIKNLQEDIQLFQTIEMYPELNKSKLFNFVFKDNINDYKYLNDKREIFIGTYEEMVMEEKHIKERRQVHYQELEKYKEDSKKLQNDIRNYNKSGFFGGRPWFDWNGELATLERRCQTLSDVLSKNDSNELQLNTEMSNLDLRLQRLFSEIQQFCAKTIVSMNLSIEKINSNINEVETNKSKYVCDIKKLQWTNSVEKIMNEDVVKFTEKALITIFKKLDLSGELGCKEFLCCIKIIENLSKVKAF